jgi:hypothetical protein
MLDQLGCTTSRGSGRLKDRDIYQALLARDHTLLTTLTREIGQRLILEDVDYVVGDAAEGFNPVHDVCRLIIDAAVEMARRACNRPIPNFGFRLDWRKERQTIREQNGARTLVLDQKTFARKLSAARAYSELESDVESVLGNNGLDHFRLERLDPIPAARPGRDVGRPYYEEYGEKLVESGIYDQVIRYRAHLMPLAETLLLTIQEGL